jgi:hypothetical protein
MIAYAVCVAPQPGSGVEDDGKILLPILHIIFLLFVLFCSALANAETTAGIKDNGNGTFTLARFCSWNDRGCVDQVGKDANAFCTKRNRYFILSERSGDVYSRTIYSWTLKFECITDEKKAERLRRLNEMPLGGDAKGS